MTESLINLTNGSTSGAVTNDGVTSYTIENGFSNNTGGSAAPIVSNLPDTTGANTGWTFFQNQGTDSHSFIGVSPPYTGDADWVNNVGSDGNGGVNFWFEATGDTRIFGYGNLDSTKAYRFEGFSAREDNGESRPSSWTIEGDTQTIESIANNSETVIFTDLSPDTNDEIIISVTSDTSSSYTNCLRLVEQEATVPTIRKGGTETFDKPSGIGTITGVTLNGNTITLDSQDASTFTVTDSGSGVTTSDSYDLVATGDTTETISVQVNVYGIIPSNNPLRVQGTAQGDLTSVQIRVTDGASIDATELYYTGAGITDANGNLSNIDLNSASVVADDLVLMHIKTSGDESIIATETVELI